MRGRFCPRQKKCYVSTAKNGDRPENLITATVITFNAEVLSVEPFHVEVMSTLSHKDSASIIPEAAVTAVKINGCGVVGCRSTVTGKPSRN